jgi:hypothetical protein
MGAVPGVANRKMECFAAAGPAGKNYVLSKRIASVVKYPRSHAAIMPVNARGLEAAYLRCAAPA